MGLGLALTGCVRRPPFERSCGGEYIDACLPYEYAQVLTATLTPDGVRPSDPLGRVTLRATFQTCGAPTPAPAALQVSAVVGASSSETDAPLRDGGVAFPMGQRVVPLGTYFNRGTDPLVFEAVVDNPFDATTIPGNRDITLRFRPLVNACEGDGVEISYRTGPPLP